VAHLKKQCRDVALIEITDLEHIASSLAILGFSSERIEKHMGLSVRSVNKLLENVRRKISQHSQKQRSQS